MAITLEKLEKNIEKSIPEIQKIVANSQAVALTDTLGLMTQRIFNRGEDSNGNPIGNYSTKPDGSPSSYMQKRQDAGLQTDKIDLQFTGDLFRSVDIGVKEEIPVIGITTSRSAEVSESLEIKLGEGSVTREIFRPSQTEIDSAARVATDYIMEGLREIVRGWGK